MIILGAHSTQFYSFYPQNLYHHVDHTEKTFARFYSASKARIYETFRVALPFVYNFAAGAIAGEFFIPISSGHTVTNPQIQVSLRF